MYLPLQALGLSCETCQRACVFLPQPGVWLLDPEVGQEPRDWEVPAWSRDGGLTNHMAQHAESNVANRLGTEGANL